MRIYGVYLDMFKFFVLNIILHRLKNYIKNIQINGIITKLNSIMNNIRMKDGSKKNTIIPIDRN